MSKASMPKKVILVSRCAWTLYNFRAGLMRALQHKGATVIGGGAADGSFEAKITALGVPFVPLPVDKKGTNVRADIALFWSLYRWYRREKPDVVHHFTIKPVIYGSIAARLARVPRIVNTVTGLGYVFMEDHIAWLRRFVEQQYKVALTCAHFTFFQNRDDLELFQKRCLVKPHKTGLLPGSGVDCSLFTPSSTVPVQPDRPLTFLLMARLLREKGVYEFVEAARLIKRDLPHVQFHLLGDRDERNPTVISHRALDLWQAEGVVAWLGAVTDVRPVIAQADVVVLPSYREGIPRSLLEAAAMGKPLITTDAVGCRDVVEEGVNGLRVPVQDAPALARAMVRMMEDPAMRQRMGKAGRTKVEREFDERLVIEKIWRIYSEETL